MKIKPRPTGAQPAADKQNTTTDICLPSEVSEITRRQMIATGTSLAAWAPVANLLGSKTAYAQEDYPPQRNLIWINMGGGWDILETTDPKVNSTSGVDVIYDYNLANPLANSSDGTRIGRWLPNMAAIGQDMMVVRGMAMGTTSHMAGSVYMDTGILSNAGRVNAASIPAIVASESQATIPIIQLNGGTEPMTDRGLLKSVSAVRANNLELYRSMYPDSEDAIERKMAVLDYLRGSITRLQDQVGENDRLSNLAAAEEKVRGQFEDNVGASLALTDADREAFASTDPQLARGSDSFALALKLINDGICNCVNLGIGGFDTHSQQTQRLQPILQRVDFLVSSLVAGLRASGQLDNTLIVLFSDFGRTPLINGSNGRDHWPTGGAIVIGGGIDGGRAVGATTDEELSAVDLIDPNTGLVTNDSSTGVQLNPTHLGGMVLELTLGSAYSQYRPYLEAIPAMTRLRGG